MHCLQLPTLSKRSLPRQSGSGHACHVRLLQDLSNVLGGLPIGLNFVSEPSVPDAARLRLHCTCNKIRSFPGLAPVCAAKLPQRSRRQDCCCRAAQQAWRLQCASLWPANRPRASQVPPAEVGQACAEDILKIVVSVPALQISVMHGRATRSNKHICAINDILDSCHCSRRQLSWQVLARLQRLEVDLAHDRHDSGHRQLNPTRERFCLPLELMQRTNSCRVGRARRWSLVF